MSSAEDEKLRPAPPADAAPSSAGSEPGDRQATADQAGLSRTVAVVAAVPLALSAAIAALTVVASVCLLADDYRARLILPFGLPAAALAAAAVLWRLPAVPRRQLWPSLAAFAVVVGTVAYNLRYSAQDIFVTRDPGTYAVTAQWLAHHASAKIGTQPAVFGSVPGLGASSLGFGNTSPGLIQSQYPTAAPMLVAMGGWISDAWLLRIAPFIGGAALLSFFGLARAVVREWWAVGAMTLLAVSLPMLHFSRAVYSEPSAMVFLLGGMALLFACEQRGGLPLHLAAGLTGGATGLARVDGGLFLIAAAGYAVMRVARSARHRTALAEVGVLLLAALVPYGLGMRVTATLSPLYWFGANGHWNGASAHAPEALLPGVTAVVILLAGLPVVAVTWRNRAGRARGLRWSAWLTDLLAVVLVLAAIVGATRPLWFTAHQYIGPTFTNWIAYWQRLQHLPIDGTRSYAEYTLNWISWYDSVIVVVLGVLGIAWLVRRFGRTGSPPLLGFLLVFLSFGTLSLIYPDITADQIWSVRRFLPIVIPGFLVGAAYCASRLWRWGRKGQVGVAVLSLAALGLTVNTSAALADVREGVPQLAEIENVCHNLPAHAAVVTMGGVSGGYMMSVRAWCRVPVTGLAVDTSFGAPADSLVSLRDQALSQGYHLVVLTDAVATLPRTANGTLAPVQPLSHIVSTAFLPTLTHAARDPWRTSRTLYLATVNPDGTVSTPPGQRTLTATG